MSRLTAAAGALLVAACAGETTVKFPYYATDRTHTYSTFVYAGGGRDLRTVIYGNPTSAPKEAFEAAVIAAMQGRNWGPPTHFTTTPGPSAREGYRVVLVFSGDPYMHRKAVCGDVDSASPAPVTDGVRLHAAFCHRSSPLSSAQVSIAGLGGPDDPRLDRAVAQAVLHLFPLPETRNPDQERVLIP